MNNMLLLAQQSGTLTVGRSVRLRFERCTIWSGCTMQVRNRYAGARPATRSKQGRDRHDTNNCSHPDRLEMRSSNWYGPAPLTRKLGTPNRSSLQDLSLGHSSESSAAASTGAGRVSAI